MYGERTLTTYATTAKTAEMTSNSTIVPEQSNSLKSEYYVICITHVSERF